MEMNYYVETLDGVSDSLREFYSEHKDGDKSYYTLNVTGVKPQDEFDKVYSALTKERKLREEKEKALSAFGDYTPDSISKLKDELDTLKISKSSTNEDDYQKRFSEAKAAWQKSEDALKQSFEVERGKYETLLQDKERENINMRLENALSVLYSEKGDPSGRDLAFNLAKNELKWNPDTNNFETHDGVLTIKDWMEESLFKHHSCLLKSSLSAGARGSDSTKASYERFFDPSSPDYSEDPTSTSYLKRIEFFRKDPSAAKALLSKFAKR